MFRLGEQRIKAVARDLVLELIYRERLNDEDRARDPSKKECESKLISCLICILQSDIQLSQVDDLTQHSLHERDWVRVDIFRVSELVEVLQGPVIAV